jgi:hypothetical protein
VMMIIIIIIIIIHETTLPFFQMSSRHDN